MNFYKYISKYIPFKLTKEECEEKRRNKLIEEHNKQQEKMIAYNNNIIKKLKEEDYMIEKRNRIQIRKLIEEHVKMNNWMLLRNDYLGTDIYYYDKNEDKIYAISYRGSPNNIEFINVSDNVDKELRIYNSLIIK